jgi:RHS repeat-associated protein
VRRVFLSTASAPAYSYDPYGNALQSTAPLTDFGYAGMFYNADSGLYLTQYRAYNPVIARWLSRDPLGESSDQAANLYAYVNENPVGLRDPEGTAPEIVGGPFTPIPTRPNNPVQQCQVIPICMLSGIGIIQTPGLFPTTVCNYEGAGGRSVRIQSLGKNSCKAFVPC